jgi:5-methylcytosine-specific restriction endonuclease McrA
MPWLKSSDDSDDDPLIMALCVRRSQRYILLGAMFALRCYAARHLTNGWVPAAVVGEIPKTTRLKLLSNVENGVSLVHQRGDACECIEDLYWPEGAAYAYYVHGYLDDNPTADEWDLRRRKREEGRSADLRDQAFRRDAGRCRYCSVQVGSWADNRSGRGACLDHVDPARADGIVNLVLACRECNSKKGNRTPEQAGMTLQAPPTEPPTDPVTASVATGPTTSSARTGRDGTGKPPMIRKGRANPYRRTEPNPDHHAGLPPPDERQPP